MKIIIATFALVYATSTVSADSDTCSNLEFAYPNAIPWVSYQGEDYIFTRQKYNSVCVDSQGREFEYGTVEVVFPPINEDGGSCNNICVKGPTVIPARGCTQLPPSNRLVGFQYDCERATCKCLYEAGTLSNQYSQCFDEINTGSQGTNQEGGMGGGMGGRMGGAGMKSGGMGGHMGGAGMKSGGMSGHMGRAGMKEGGMGGRMGSGGMGTGQVSGTKPQQGETCYSLRIQSTNPPPSPTPPVGTSICTYAPDYDCYKTGHPVCCLEDGGANCPDYLTMCDNHAEGESGFDYCTNAPDYQCYNTSVGQPSCCSEPGGAFMNCPQTKPPCDDGAPKYLKYLRSNK